MSIEDRAMDVLLVDDDEASRFLAKRALREVPDVTIHEAGNGEHAISFLDARRVDVVLTDFKMGLRNGVDVLCHAMRVQPHARRILMSGTLALAQLDKEAHRACVDHAFEKPLGREAWHDALRLALRETA